MKNPFRTRYRVQPYNTPDDFLFESPLWVVVKRKWYQRSWCYAQWDYDIVKTPKFHHSKKAAIESITAYPLN